jgi:NDP-sugar pyrophosphorylase family protein
MSLDGIKKLGSKLKKSKPTSNFIFIFIFFLKKEVLGYHEKLSGTNAFSVLKTTKKGRTLSIILKEEDDDEEQEEARARARASELSIV